jgi:hypothetical protein
MKIGIYNILTTLWFIIMLSCGSILTYTTWDKIFSSDIIFIAKFFVIIIYILTLGTLIFLLIKFRLLFITKDKLIIVYIFRLKKTTILIDEIKTTKWTTWDIKAHNFISLTITDKSKKQITLTDFELENFDSFVSSILGDNYLDKSLYYFQSQAKQNKSLTYVLAIGSITLFIMCLFKLNLNNSNTATQAIFIFIIITIIATTKRIIKYRQIEKYGI